MAGWLFSDPSHIPYRDELIRVLEVVPPCSDRDMGTFGDPGYSKSQF